MSLLFSSSVLLLGAWWLDPGCETSFQDLPPRAPAWQDQEGATFLQEMEELRRRDDHKVLMQRMEERLPEDLRDPRWLSLLGEGAWRAGQLRRAVEVWEYLSRVSPYHPVALAGLSRWDALQGRTAAALRGAEQAVRAGPEDPRAWEALAHARHAGRETKAAESMERAVELLAASETEDSPLLARARHWAATYAAEEAPREAPAALREVPPNATPIPFLDPGDGSVLLELFLEERQILALVDPASATSARSAALDPKTLTDHLAWKEGVLACPPLGLDKDLDRVRSARLGMEVSLVLGRDAFPGGLAPIVDRKNQVLLVLQGQDAP